LKESDHASNIHTKKLVCTKYGQFGRNSFPNGRNSFQSAKPFSGKIPTPPPKYTYLAPYLRAVSTGGLWGVGHTAPPPQCCNIAVLSGNFNNFNDTLVGQIQPKILHNFLKSNSCWKKFDKFTKILLKNCTNYGKLIARQQFWENKY
jgi:hypothetical protein